MKQKRKGHNYWFGIILIIFVILIVGGVIYYKMPKRYCETTITIQKADLQSKFCSEGLYYGCLEDLAIIPEGTIEVICEEGAYQVFDAIVETRSPERKTCLFKVEEEHCEIR